MKQSRTLSEDRVAVLTASTEEVAKMLIRSVIQIRDCLGSKVNLEVGPEATVGDRLHEVARGIATLSNQLQHWHKVASRLVREAAKEANKRMRKADKASSSRREFIRKIKIKSDSNQPPKRGSGIVLAASGASKKPGSWNSSRHSH